MKNIPKNKAFRLAIIGAGVAGPTLAGILTKVAPKAKIP